jgi:hypothetical protein
MSLSHEQKSLIETIAEDISQFSIDNIHEVLPQLMLQANLYKTLNVSQKKKMIIRMLEHLIDITDGPGDDAVWDPILKRMLPGMLDLIVEANNGKLVIKKKNKWLRRFLFCF